MFRSAVALASLIVYRSIQRSGWDPWVVEGVPATEPALPNNAAYPPHPTTPPYWKASTPSTTHGSHPPEPYSSVCCNTQWATPTWTYATADLNIAAFIILPGLIERCRPAKRLRLIELLKSITTDPDFATETALLAIAEESHIKGHKEPAPHCGFLTKFLILWSSHPKRNLIEPLPFPTANLNWCWILHWKTQSSWKLRCYVGDFISHPEIYMYYHLAHVYISVKGSRVCKPCNVLDVQYALVWYKSTSSARVDGIRGDSSFLTWEW